MESDVPLCDGRMLIYHAMLETVTAHWQLRSFEPAIMAVQQQYPLAVAHLVPVVFKMDCLTYECTVPLTIPSKAPMDVKVVLCGCVLAPGAHLSPISAATTPLPSGSVQIWNHTPTPLNCQCQWWSTS